MRILDASDLPDHPVERFASVGFQVGKVGTSLALWVQGEEHETSSRAGVTALILEGEGLFEALPPTR